MEFPLTAQENIFNSIQAHQGSIEGLPNRSEFVETLKLWCLPAFLDAYCYSILSKEGEGFIRRTYWNLMEFGDRKKPFKESAEESISTVSIRELEAELSLIRMRPFVHEPFGICDAADLGIIYHGQNSKINLTWTGGVSKDWRKIEKWFDATISKLDKNFPEPKQG
jgi:hypothetical protein